MAFFFFFFFLTGKIKLRKKEQNYKICNKSTKKTGKCKEILQNDPNNY